MIQKFLLLIISLSCQILLAQDPHFSQYQSAPLLINPALTGAMKNDYRFSANFRNQRWSAGNNFITNAVSYEQKMARLELQEAVNKFAWGIAAVYDVSAGGVYKNSSFLLSASYTKPLDYEGTRNLTVGLDGVVTSRSISNNNLTFSNQFNGSYFDLSLPNRENIESYRKTFASFGVGLLYSVEKENDMFLIGTSIYHVNKPQINFDIDKLYRLPMRQVVHSTYRTHVGQSLNHVLLNVNYMQQGGAQNILVGGAFGLVRSADDDNQAALTTGIWYRYRESVIPYVGFDWRKYQLGLTYDILGTGGDLSPVKSTSFEISLRYSGKRRENAFINNITGREF